MIFVLTADSSMDIAKIVRRFSEKPELNDDDRARLWAMLAKAGEPDDLRYALDTVHAIRWFSRDWPFRPRSETKNQGEIWPSRSGRCSPIKTKPCKRPPSPWQAHGI